MATLNGNERQTSITGHHRHGFRRFNTEILQSGLEPSLVDCLVARCVLTIDDAEKIGKTSSQIEFNKLLLHILKGRPYDTFSIFIDALTTTGYFDSCLVNQLKTFSVKDIQPHEEHANESNKISDDLQVKFQKSYKILVEQITAPENLADRLLEYEVFTSEDRQYISSLPTLHRKIRTLLSKVVNKSAYEKCLVALKSGDPRDHELAAEVENTIISQKDKLMLQIGIKISQQNETDGETGVEITQQSEENWRVEDDMFVETRGTTKLYNIIKQKHFITIIGNSGSGKTAAMRHVVLKLKDEEGFQVIAIPFDSPDKIIAYRKEHEKQIFVIDDVLGKYQINPMLVEKWERLNSDIQHCLDNKVKNMKVLLTLRKQVVNDKKFEFCSSVIRQHIVDLDDDQISLTKEERKQILMKHLKIHGMEGRVTEHDIEAACSVNYAFPLLCRVVASNEERLRNIVKFFLEPFSILEEEIKQLWTKNINVYCSLVFCMLFNGKIGKEFFDVNSEQHKLFRKVTEACGLNSNISRKVLEDSLTTVVGTYVSYEDGTFYFMHDAFLEAISLNFAQMNPNAMFSFCEIGLIRDRVRVKTDTPNDDEITNQYKNCNVIFISENQFEIITKRFLTECENHRFSNVLLSHLIKDDNFVEYFGEEICSKNQTSIKPLMVKESVERYINKRTIFNFVKSLLVCLFTTCICFRPFCPKFTFHNIDDQEKITEADFNNAGIKHVIRAPSRQSRLIHWIVASGCSGFFRYLWEKASKQEKKSLLSRDWIYPFAKPFFPLAVLGGNVDIIKTLLSDGADVNCFSAEGETPLCITAKSGKTDIADLLISRGANVNQADICSHKLPSVICVENETVDVLKVLLKNNCDMNLVDMYEIHSTMLQALLTRKRNIVNVLLEFDSKGYPLHTAILNNDVEFLTLNIGNEDINSKTKNGFTPLHYATQVNDANLIRSLLGCLRDDEVTTGQSTVADISQGTQSPTVDIHSKTKNGLTPLHLAVLNDHVEAVKLLIQENADRNSKDYFGRIPLHYAQSTAISGLLLNSKCSRPKDNNSSKSCWVRVKLSEEVVVDIDREEHRQQNMCSTLCQNILPFGRCRETINQPDIKGNTPLHVVVKTSRDLPQIEGNCDIADNIKLLWERGANIHLVNDEGYRPSDFLENEKDFKTLITSKALKEYITKYEYLSIILLVVSLVLSYGVVAITVSSTVSNIQNVQEVDVWIMYYCFLIIMASSIITDTMIVRVFVQLWKTKWGYRIAGFILPLIMQISVAALFIVYKKRFTRSRFYNLLFVILFNSVNLTFAIRIRELLSVSFKYLQNIFLVQFLVNFLLSVTTIIVFVHTPLDVQTISNLNKTDDRCINDVVKKQSNQGSDFTNINCTENYMSFPFTLMYMIIISISILYFAYMYEKTWVQPQTTGTANRIVSRYLKDMCRMVSYFFFMVLIVIVVYEIRTKHIVNELQSIYNSIVAP